MSFLKMSLNNINSVSEPPSHLEAENSVSVILERPTQPFPRRYHGKGVHVVTGRLSPLVTAEIPGPRPHGPQEPRGSAASGSTSAREPDLRCIRQSTQRSCQGRGHKAPGTLPAKGLPLKELTLSGKKKNTEKPGICKQFLLPSPHTSSLQNHRLPQNQAVHMGVRGSAGEYRESKNESPFSQSRMTWPHL